MLLKLCFYTHYILHFLEESVKNCTPIHILLHLLGDLVPQTPYRGFARGPYWETSVPQTPGPAPTT